MFNKIGGKKEKERGRLGQREREMEREGIIEGERRSEMDKMKRQNDICIR
jgi:hypothetical protein